MYNIYFGKCHQGLINVNCDTQHPNCSWSPAFINTIPSNKSAILILGNVTMASSHLDSQNELDLFVIVIVFLNATLPSISENCL